MEQLPIVLVTSLVAGIKYPRYVFILDIAYCISRLLYSCGYMRAPNSRVVGVIPQTIVVLIFIILASLTSYDIFMG